MNSINNQFIEGLLAHRLKTILFVKIATKMSDKLRFRTVNSQVY